jgi:hypothetical protein
MLALIRVYRNIYLRMPIGGDDTDVQYSTWAVVSMVISYRIFHIPVLR